MSGCHSQCISANTLQHPGFTRLWAGWASPAATATTSHCNLQAAELHPAQHHTYHQHPVELHYLPVYTTSDYNWLKDVDTRLATDREKWQVLTLVPLIHCLNILVKQKIKWRKYTSTVSTNTWELLIKCRIIASQDGSGGDKLETVDVGRGEDYVKKNINFNKKIDDKNLKLRRRSLASSLQLLILSKTIILKSLAEHWAKMNLWYSLPDPTPPPSRTELCLTRTARPSQTWSFCVRDRPGFETSTLVGVLIF